jgi:putative transposase
MDNKDLYIEEILLNTVKSILSGRVNEILEEAEFPIPPVEFGKALSGYAVTPVLRLSTRPRSGVSHHFQLFRNVIEAKWQVNTIYTWCQSSMEVVMRKKREYVDGAMYHVTSRTNDRIRVFKCNIGKKTMLLTLRDAKDRFGFKLLNFCIMPTHIHLLILPREKANLSKIMQWIKTQSAKRWNAIHGSTDHLWGDRFFARIIKGPRDYFKVMDYINQNPVKAELVQNPEDWKASGAYYVCNDISGLVDYTALDRLPYIKLLGCQSPLQSSTRL